jgi:hypothetical protein
MVASGSGANSEFSELSPSAFRVWTDTDLYKPQNRHAQRLEHIINKMHQTC